MSRLETQFLEKLGDSWQSATPGFCIQAYASGKKLVDIEVGLTYPYYDWASLTKIVFTTASFMACLDQKKFRLSDPVSQWISWFPAKSGIRIRDVLSHSAGLIWWYPFFKSIEKSTTLKSTPEEAWREFESIFERRIKSDLNKSSATKSHAQAVYSDLDFFTLGFVLESIQENSLYSIWSEMRDQMGLAQTDFHRQNKPHRAMKNYAPTEHDPRRGKTLQGEAHDENTWALKGVAPHAGLFGPIEDLSHFGLLLRSGMRGERKIRGKRGELASPETVRLFTKRSLPRSRGDWALGFMMPTKGSASCGANFSLSSVGHTGFTGASLWFDPKKDLLVTILSNRVHPTRDNREFVALRPKLHNWLAELL